MPTNQEAIRHQSLPLAPQEALQAKAELLPNEVIDTFNELIAEKLSGRFARVPQNEVLERLAALGFDRQQVFDRHMLDVEDVYRAAGWKVRYDRPAYNETWYDPMFEFCTGPSTTGY